MSSILRALKKVERETRLQEDSRLWGKAINSNLAAYRQDSRHRPARIRSFFLLLLFLGISAGSAWFLTDTWRPARQTADSEKSASTSPPSPAAVDVEVSRAVAGQDSSGRISPLPTVVPPAEPATEQPAAAEFTVMPWQQTNAALSPPAPSPSSDNQPAAPEEAVTVEPTPLAEPDPPVVTSASMPPAPARLPLFTGQNLKLQAITWSRTPEKRLAVISNKIVREGDSVGGYLVALINQDDVVVSQKDGQWMLSY